MKHYFLCSVLVGALTANVSEGLAQNKQTGSIPKTGFRAEFLNQLDEVSKKIIDLAQAVPQKKYTWRPSPGVRSVGEVYLHIARSNYFLLRFAGIPLPKDLDLGSDASTWEQSTTDKEKIVAMLRRSFDHVRQAILKIPDADLEKPVKMFGLDTTVRDVFFNTALHQHEHLGQSIAYARMNGVVPPWTAEREAR